MFNGDSKQILKCSVSYWMSWAEQVHTGFWWRNLKERNLLKDLGVDGRIILKYIRMGGHGLDSSS
jgi:hypothetical protein